MIFESLGVPVSVASSCQAFGSRAAVVVGTGRRDGARKE